MNDIIKQLKKRMKEIRMSDKTRSQIRHLLLLEMDRNPVRDGKGFRHHASKNVVSHRFFNLLIIKKQYMPLLLIIALLVSGGGVAFAAEDSVPGDALYPVKVGFNEEFRSIFAFKTEQKADWEVRRFERRFEEVEELLVSGDLDDEKLEKFSERLDKYANRLERLISRLEEKDNFPAASDVIARLEASLDAHEQIVELLSDPLLVLGDESVNEESFIEEENDDEDEDEGRKDHAKPFMRDIKLRIGFWASSGKKFDDWADRKEDSEVKEFAENKLKMTGRKLKKVREFIDKKSERIEDEEHLAQTEEVFSEAQVLYESALESFENEEYIKAFRILQVSWKTAHEAKVLTVARGRFVEAFDREDDDHGLEEEKDDIDKEEDGDHEGVVEMDDEDEEDSDDNEEGDEADDEDEEDDVDEDENQ